MVNVTSFVVGAVMAASAAAGPVSMEASAPDHLERRHGTRLTHRHREEPVLRLELVLRPPAPERDASDQRGRAPPQQLVAVDRDVGPGERAEAEVGDDRRAAALVVRQTACMRVCQRAGVQPLPSFTRHGPPGNAEAAG